MIGFWGASPSSTKSSVNCCWQSVFPVSRNITADNRKSLVFYSEIIHGWFFFFFKSESLKQKIVIPAMINTASIESLPILSSNPWHPVSSTEGLKRQSFHRTFKWVLTRRQNCQRYEQLSSAKSFHPLFTCIHKKNNSETLWELTVNTQAVQLWNQVLDHNKNLK